MNCVTPILLSVILAATGPVWARDEIRTEPVHFKHSATSTVVEASIKGYETVDYLEIIITDAGK